MLAGVVIFKAVDAPVAEAVMDKCPRDRLEAAAKLLEDGLASTIAKRALVVEKVPYRDPPDAADFWHTEDGAIIGESYHDARGDKMMRESATREESARRLAKRLAGDRLLNKPPREFHGRTLSDKAPLKRFPHTDIWTKNRAVPWHSDDLRGRDVFKGYVSTHTFSTGRCCWDPNKMPIVTPGPTTSDDFVQPHGNFMGEDVKGLPFSRMTDRGPGMPGPTRCISKPRVKKRRSNLLPIPIHCSARPCPSRTLNLLLRFDTYRPRDQDRSSLRSGRQGPAADSWESPHNNEADRREVPGQGSQPGRLSF